MSGELAKRSSGSYSSGPMVLKRILVPIDGSENSIRAAKSAISLAKTHNAEIIIVSVIAVPSSIIGDEGVLAALEKDADAWIGTVESYAKKEGVRTRREILRSSSSVVEPIIQHAQMEDVDLIVIGTRGMGGFKKLLIGSVSMGVTLHSNGPVLIIR